MYKNVFYCFFNMMEHRHTWNSIGKIEIIYNHAIAVEIYFLYCITIIHHECTTVFYFILYS